MNYRREIDGLRAIAVLPVIFFHAGFEAFSGGYVGVDVFFVISGYLITTIILAEIEHGSFSLISFYERRARRILPALFFVMLTSLPFAWLWLLPSDMKDFAKSLMAVPIFISNVLFWRESGYFDSAAELKPLLHTWSLAVEEQYYVFFPLFLMLFLRFGKRLILIVLGLLFLASLSAAQWAGNIMPAAAFYLLPTRIWEILCGVFVAFYMAQCNCKRFGKNFREFAGWLGVGLIAYAVFNFNKTTPFPGLYALVPTSGAILIILFVAPGTTVANFLGNRVFVGLGLISYSAYLWHQPLFAFARHKSLTEPSHVMFLVLSGSALLLAFLSWKYVEKPFRKNQSVVRAKTFYLATSSSLLFICLGYLGYASNGFDGRFEKVLFGDIGHFEFHKYVDTKYLDCKPASVANSALVWDGFLRCKQSKADKPEIILLGDSHAEHLFLGLAESKPHSNIAFYTMVGKPYVNNPLFKPIFDELLSNEMPQHILLTMHFGGLLNSKATGLYDGFSLTIKSLQKVGKDVTLIGNVPRFNQDPAACVFSLSLKSSASCALNIEDVLRQRNVYDGVLKQLANDFGLKYISLDEAICVKEKCGMFQGDSILFRDKHHLNIVGSKLVGRHIADRLPF